MADIKFTTAVDSEKGEVSLGKLDKGVDKLEKSTKKAASGFGKFTSQFKKSVISLGLGVATIAALRQAWSSLSRFVSESVKGAMEAEEAEKKLEVVLKSTGHAAGLMKDELIEMAEELMNVTTYEDDVIMGAEHLLLTFTKIGKKVFPEALETVLNMSQALGTDLRGSAIQLGKALQDPIMGATALRRVGVNLSESMMEQIKIFVKSGQIMKAQRLILSELAIEFGGTARAATETFGGSLKQLGNTYRMLKDEAGEAIIKSEEFREMIRDTNVVLKDIIDSGVIPEIFDAFAEGFKILKTYDAQVKLLVLVTELLHKKADATREDKKETDALKWAIGKLDEQLLILGFDISTIIPFWTRQKKEISDTTDDIKEQTIFVREATEGWALMASSINAVRAQYTKLPEPVTDAWEALRRLKEGSVEQVSVYGELIEGTDEWRRAIEEQNKTQRLQVEYTQMAISGMQYAYEDFFGAMFGMLKTMAQAWIVETIMEDPSMVWYAKLIASAAAVAAVEALYAGIAGKAEGGWVGLRGSEIVKVGERGPEYITPANQITNTYNNQMVTREIHLHQTFQFGTERIVDETIIKLKDRAERGIITLPGKTIQ